MIPTLSGEIQRASRRQHDHSVDRAARSTRQGHQHVHHASQGVVNFELLKLLNFNLNFNNSRYSYHYPELIKLVPEATKYSKSVLIIKDRKKLHENEEAKNELKGLNFFKFKLN